MAHPRRRPALLAAVVVFGSVLGMGTVRPDGEEHAKAVVVAVHVVYDRQPAAGVTVVAVVPGEPAPRTALTNAEGVATLEVPHDPHVEFFLRRGGGLTDGTALVAASARDGRYSLEMWVTPTRRMAFHVRRGSRPFLPRPFACSVDGVPLAPRSIDLEQGSFLAECPTAMSEAPSELRFEAKGSPPVVRTLRTDEMQADLGAIIDLDGGEATIAVEVRGVKRWEAGPSLSLQRWDALGETWVRDRTVPLPLPWPGGRARAVVRNAPPGRYRVWDTTYDLRTEAIDVGAVGDVNLVLDMTGGGCVKVRVLGPSGEIDARAGVRCWQAVPGKNDRVMSWSGGEVRIPIGAHATMRIEAHHPVWSPHPTEGVVTVTGPQDGVVLRLVEGPNAVVEIEPPGGTSWGAIMEGAWVKLRRPGTTDPLLHRAIRDGSRFKFGGYPAGRYDILLDLGSQAPVLLRDVDLGGGATDLGHHRLEAGATLHVRALLPDGEMAPALTVHATGEPPWELLRTGGWRRGESSAVIRGLLPGRYHVVFFGGELLAGKGREQWVDVPAGGEARATLDLRPEALDPAEGR